MKKQFVKSLKLGDLINEVFYVWKKSTKNTKTGEKYLYFLLKDRTGSIGSYLWENFKKGEAINPGEFALVQGRVDEFENKLRIKITDIVEYKGKIDPEDFLPKTKRNIENMFSQLMGYIDNVKNPYLKNLLLSVFNDESIAEKFKKAPAGRKAHQAYLGGLLEHTLSILRFSEGIENEYTEIDKDLLIAGIIFHDIGKIDAYTYEKVIDHSIKGKLLTHILLGYDLVKEKIRGIKGFPENLAWLIYHMILSHHGELEYGSPVKPLFLEAEILYHLDNLDAKVFMFREATEGTDDSALWTGYHSLLKRKIFLRKKEEEVEE